MKKLKLLLIMKNVQSFFAAFAFIALFAMSSCSSSEDERIVPRGTVVQPKNYSNVYNEWQINSITASEAYDLDGNGISNVDILNYEMADGDCFADKTWNFDTSLDFYLTSGSRVCNAYEIGDYDGTFSLNTTDGTVTINYDAADMLDEIFNIKSISDKAMVLEKSILIESGEDGQLGNGPSQDVIGQVVTFTYSFRIASELE
jgi:hypothetical protein